MPLPNLQVDNELVPLQFLFRGQFARISELVGLPEQVRRMHELGMISGAVVEMVQPGSPCIVRLGGQKLCFRETDAVGVMVRAGAWD